MPDGTIKIKKYIKSKSFLSCVIGYVVAAGMLAYEYMYYNDSLDREVYHYSSSIAKAVTDLSLTRFSGLWMAVVAVLPLIPLVALIFKKKTIKSVVLSIVSLTLNSIAALIVVLVICNYDSVSDMNIKYGHFHRFDEPYGNKVLCLQEMICEFSVFDFGEMYDCMELIYIETGSNELKKVQEHRGCSLGNFNVEWGVDEVFLTFKSEMVDYGEGVIAEGISISYDEWERLRNNR